MGTQGASLCCLPPGERGLVSPGPTAAAVGVLGGIARAPRSPRSSPTKQEWAGTHEELGAALCPFPNLVSVSSCGTELALPAAWPPRQWHEGKLRSPARSPSWPAWKVKGSCQSIPGCSLALAVLGAQGEKGLDR